MYRWRNLLVVASLTGLAACDTAYEDDDEDSIITGFPIDEAVGDGSTDAGSTPYGPDNSWYHADASEVPTDLAGTGRGADDIAYNLTLSDQLGDEVELYQFFGQVVLLDVYAEW